MLPHGTRGILSHVSKKSKPQTPLGIQPSAGAPVELEAGGEHGEGQVPGHQVLQQIEGVKQGSVSQFN